MTLAYTGVRQVSRTSKVGNSHSGGTINEVLSTTQEIYDRQGRLYQVKEQAEANATNTTTTYTYDVGNRLSRVQQATSAATQNRWFTYDNRGFLTSEQHPEKGTSGNGTVTYSNYDARGPRAEQDGRPAQPDLHLRPRRAPDAGDRQRRPVAQDVHLWHLRRRRLEDERPAGDGDALQLRGRAVQRHGRDHRDLRLRRAGKGGLRAARRR